MEIDLSSNQTGTLRTHMNFLEKPHIEVSLGRTWWWASLWAVGCDMKI